MGEKRRHGPGRTGVGFHGGRIPRKNGWLGRAENGKICLAMGRQKGCKERGRVTSEGCWNMARERCRGLAAYRRKKRRHRKIDLGTQEKGCVIHKLTLLKGSWTIQEGRDIAHSNTTKRCPNFTEEIFKERHPIPNRAEIYKNKRT